MQRKSHENHGKKVAPGEVDARSARPVGTNQIELPQGMRDRISRKAHESWQQRGHRESYALQDWPDVAASFMGGQP
jgi:hypothetical protein